MIDKNKTYIGIVVDNNDPLRESRVKVNVLDVYDGISTEDIPFASPWKDINGNSSNVPDIGKVVTVIFDQGDKFKPEYIYADHYNINLESKLKSISEEDYISMKSLIFDHKTQVYVNDSEGLMIDHKYNNVNIKNEAINLNLKDNSASVNIGDASATQQTILGNHFMDWFDKFVDNLLGSSGGPYLGNLAAPVIANPAFIAVLQEYKAKRNPVFLSHHVNVVDNNKIKTVKNKPREDNPQIGDTWQSTKENNNLTGVVQENFQPQEGSKDVVEQNEMIENGEVLPEEVMEVVDIPQEESPESELDKIVRLMEHKNYEVLRDGKLNIVALRSRNKDLGDVTGIFDDRLIVFYENGGNWVSMEYYISTVPGIARGSKIITFGQFINQGRLYGDNFILDNVSVYVNKGDKYDYTSEVGYERSELKPAKKTGNLYKIPLNKKSTQYFKSGEAYKDFIELCIKQHRDIGMVFNYTILSESEVNDF